MKINPISSRLLPINQQKKYQQMDMVSFTAKSLKSAKKDLLTLMIEKEIRIADQKIRRLKLQELNILNFRAVNPTSISGGTFSVRSDVDLETLRENGIRIIVDFRGEATNDFAQRCIESGFEYFNFNLNKCIYYIILLIICIII